MRDPLEEDETAQERLADEDARQLRWTAFVEVVLSFAETEGWSGVLQAVSRAMREAKDAGAAVQDDSHHERLAGSHRLSLLRPGD